MEKISGMSRETNTGVLVSTIRWKMKTLDGTRDKVINHLRNSIKTMFELLNYNIPNENTLRYTILVY